MENKFEDLLKKSTTKYYEKEINNFSNLESDIENFKSLSDMEILQLSKKIKNLSFESRTILMSKYAYKISPTETKVTFEIDNPKEKANFLNKTLSNTMGIDGYIDDKSFEKACEIIIEQENKELEKLKQKPKPKYKHILKKVAAIFLISTLSLGILLATSSTAREKLFDWDIIDFGEYSEFVPEKINPDYTEILEVSDLEINYIPEGFELNDVQEGKTIKSFTYKSKENENHFYIDFSSKVDVNSITNINTEGAIVEEIMINGNTGYIWEIKNRNYLIFFKNGIEIIVVGNIPEYEIIKIAESINKK